MSLLVAQAAKYIRTYIMLSSLSFRPVVFLPCVFEPHMTGILRIMDRMPVQRSLVICAGRRHQFLFLKWGGKKILVPAHALQPAMVAEAMRARLTRGRRAGDLIIRLPTRSVGTTAKVLLLCEGTLTP